MDKDCNFNFLGHIAFNGRMIVSRESKTERKAFHIRDFAPNFCCLCATSANTYCYSSVYCR
jgi:hypothetical protein